MARIKTPTPFLEFSVCISSVSLYSEPTFAISTVARDGQRNANEAVAQPDGRVEIKTYSRGNGKETEVARVTYLFSGKVSFFSREEITKGRDVLFATSFSSASTTLAGGPSKVCGHVNPREYTCVEVQQCHLTIGVCRNCRNPRSYPSLPLHFTVANEYLVLWLVSAQLEDSIYIYFFLFVNKKRSIKLYKK